LLPLLILYLLLFLQVFLTLVDDDKQRLELPHSTEKSKIHQMIESCWEQDPSERPTFAELLPTLASLHRSRYMLESMDN